MTKTLQAWVKGAAAAVTMAIATFVMTSAAAAGLCGPHEALTSLLVEQYLERQRGAGMTNDGKLLEIFVSEKGTWTVVVSLSMGSSCIVAEGTDWQDENLAAADPEEVNTAAGTLRLP